MKIRVLPLTLLTLLLLTACGKATNDDSKTVTITPDQIGHLLENQSFECSSLNELPCPEGISRLFILDVKDPNKTLLCTGFLVSTNRIITNHHCLSSQEQCNNTYVSIFNGHNYEVARCQTLVEAQVDDKPLEDKVIDFAVIELDRHIRTADVFGLSKSLPKLGDKLTAWVVDHVDLFKARITELNCRMSGRVSSLELENCPVIFGNSGSPVINEKGKIVGVIWGSTTNIFINEQTPLEERRLLNDTAYATEVKYFKHALSLDP